MGRKRLYPKKISLYSCMEARYPSDGSRFMYCRKGHKFGKRQGSILAFERGMPLEYSVCQGCPDIVSMNDKEVKDV